jgi:RNA polymerase sigma-70 factor, ECF subfamily
MPTPPLIAAAQQGNQAALAELYRLHQPTIHRYIARRVHNRDLADDLTQDVFVRAIRALPGFQWTGRPVEAWLTTIARNLIADHAKRAATQREIPVDDPATLRHPAVPGVEEQVLAGLDGRPVRVAVAALRQAWREVLVLDHWAGLSDRQIAARMGRSGGAVRTLKCRAAAAVRASLAA